MIFELWEFTDYRSNCFARFSEKHIRGDFHNMEIGEQRKFGNDYYLVRVK